MSDYVSKIQKTASTLFDISGHSDVMYANEIAELMVKKLGIQWPPISAENFGAFPVSRFQTTQHFLDFMCDKFGPKLQIIELGAGFTPHYLNLKGDILKYIEVDHDANSSLKKEIVHEIKPNATNLVFIGGDILDAKTWVSIKENIDTNNPVIIFSEGVVAQYFSEEQKQQLTDFMKDLLFVEGSAFVIDDTLRNHPELKDNPIISEGMSWVVQKSASKVYNAEFQTFEQEVQRWQKFLPSKEMVTIEYVNSKPEMDFALSNFKLIVCLQSKQEVVKSGLLELSRQNKTKRVWK